MTSISSRVRDTRHAREPRWSPPKTSDLRPRNVYASSALDEFVHGHTYSDMITELIQNEFDAGGSRVEMDLAINQMQVTGNGRTIDRNGWKRLSVMLGTGRLVSHSSRRWRWGYCRFEVRRCRPSLRPIVFLRITSATSESNQNSNAPSDWYSATV